MRIEWSTNVQCTVLRCSGHDFMEPDRDKLVDTLLDASHGKQEQIIIDLTSMTFRDVDCCAGQVAEALLGFRDPATRNGKALGIVVHQPAIWNALQEQRITDFVRVFGSVEQALEGSGAASSPAGLTSVGDQRQRQTQAAMESLLSGLGPGGLTAGQQQGAFTRCGARECVFFRLVEGDPTCIHSRPLYVNQRGRCPLFMLDWARSMEDADGEPSTAEADLPARRSKDEVNELIRALAGRDEQEMRSRQEVKQDTEEREFQGIVLEVPPPEALAQLAANTVASRPVAARPPSRALGQPVGQAGGAGSSPGSTPPKAAIPARKPPAREQPRPGQKEEKSGASRPVASSVKQPAVDRSRSAGGSDANLRQPAGGGPARPSDTVRRFVEAWNRKAWEEEYGCLAGCMRPFPQENYAAMREAAANKLRETGACPVQVLEHVVEEIISPTEARVAVRRSDHVEGKPARHYQQIFTLEMNNGRWEISMVREVPVHPRPPQFPPKRSR